jgi:hypothetical protein
MSDLDDVLDRWRLAAATGFLLFAAPGETEGRDRDNACCKPSELLPHVERFHICIPLLFAHITRSVRIIRQRFERCQFGPLIHQVVLAPREPAGKQKGRHVPASGTATA